MIKQEFDTQNVLLAGLDECFPLTMKRVRYFNSNVVEGNKFPLLPGSITVSSSVRHEFDEKIGDFTTNNCIDLMVFSSRSHTCLIHKDQWEKEARGEFAYIKSQDEDMIANSLMLTLSANTSSKNASLKLIGVIKSDDRDAVVERWISPIQLDDKEMSQVIKEMMVAKHMDKTGETVIEAAKTAVQNIKNSREQENKEEVTVIPKVVDTKVSSSPAASETSEVPALKAVRMVRRTGGAVVDESAAENPVDSAEEDDDISVGVGLR